MYPFINLLGRSVSMYALMSITGLIAGVGCLIFRERKKGIPATDILFLAFYGGLGAMIGAKILYLLTSIPELIQAIQTHSLSEALFAFLSGGFVFYGGLLGLVGGIAFYARIMNVSFYENLNMAIPVLPLIHAFGRIGCFFAGCCHGIPCPPPLGIAFTHAIGAPNHIPLLPVQLLEAAALFGIFFVLWRYTKQKRTTTSIVCLYIFTYAPTRFILEYFRGDAIRGSFLVFSTSQIISLLLLIAGIAILYGQKKRV